VLSLRQFYIQKYGFSGIFSFLHPIFFARGFATRFFLLIFLREEVDFYWSSFNVFLGGRLVIFRPPKSLKTAIGWG